MGQRAATAMSFDVLGCPCGRRWETAGRRTWLKEKKMGPSVGLFFP